MVVCGMSFVLKVLLFGFLVCWEGWGWSYSTPDSRTLQAMCSLLEQHQEAAGELPSSWEEFDKTIPGAFADSAVQPRERYAFLPEGSRPRLPGDRGELILISRRPFRNTSMEQGFFGRTIRVAEPLRYGVSRAGNERFRLVRLPEAEVQELFLEQGFSLPAPDNLPERPWVAQRRRQIRDSRLLLAGVLVAGSFIAYCLFSKPR